MNAVGVITALLSALFMGTVGVFAKITGLGAEVITFFRLGLGAAFMLLLLSATGQARRIILCRPTWPVLLNGAMLAGFIIFYVQAMEHTTMANAIMLVYLAPLAASLYAHFFLGERLTWASAAFIGLALFGFAMMMEFHIDLAGGDHLVGIGLGLVSMLCYAAFILINRIIDPAVHVFTRTFYQLLVGASTMAPLCLWSRPELPPHTWPWLAATGLIPGFLAILCAVVALSRLPAATFGALAYVEPIAVVVFGWALFAESLSWMQLAGGLCIIVAGVLKTTCGERAALPNPPVSSRPTA
jgi:drug/metabolite transporter (DMT)-like permease